jgi:hypothetical protein
MTIINKNLRVSLNGFKEKENFTLKGNLTLKGRFAFMNNHITPDYVARFIETSEKQFLKIEERLNDLNLKLETNKILTTEKSEMLLYKLSVIQDKINANDQKVNELNTIMMKHFAYKSKSSGPVPRDMLPTRSPSVTPPVAQPFNVNTTSTTF